MNSVEWNPKYNLLAYAGDDKSAKYYGDEGTLQLPSVLAATQTLLKWLYKMNWQETIWVFLQVFSEYLVLIARRNQYTTASGSRYKQLCSGTWSIWKSLCTIKHVLTVSRFFTWNVLQLWFYIWISHFICCKNGIVLLHKLCLYYYRKKNKRKKLYRILISKLHIYLVSDIWPLLCLLKVTSCSWTTSDLTAILPS